jgi:hypothetical protein
VCHAYPEGEGAVEIELITGPHGLTVTVRDKGRGPQGHSDTAGAGSGPRSCKPWRTRSASRLVPGAAPKCAWPFSPSRFMAQGRCMRRPAARAAPRAVGS